LGLQGFSLGSHLTAHKWGFSPLGILSSASHENIMPNPLQIRVILDSPTPVYRQIVDAIRAHCVAGRLTPGTKLPTVRDLAASLGIHFNTVAEAYRVLADEGFLLIAGRRGAVVQQRNQPATPNKDAAATEGNRLRHLIAELQSKGFRKDWILVEVATALKSQS
jgi:GntR family transcriptional regulator